MKDVKEIRIKLNKLKKKLISEVELYTGINDKELQRSAYKFVAKTKGEIKSLEWVLKESDNK